MLGQLFAGTGLGLLVGILVGLSSSPVVSVVVGALAAGMVTLLGFSRPAKEGEPALGDGSVARLGGFGVACTVAILFGLYIRTHNVLSPSIADQVNEVRKAGYSEDAARKWVANRNIGMSLAAADEKLEPATGGMRTLAESVLFSGRDSGECQYFDTKRYKNTKEHLYALEQLGGRYADYAAKISKLDAGQQARVFDALSLLNCAQ
jgi:hypothetical protein